MARALPAWPHLVHPEFEQPYEHLPTNRLLYTYEQQTSNLQLQHNVALLLGSFLPDLEILFGN
jgi:hypothetical protein